MQLQLFKILINYEKNVLETVASFVATGLDPSKSIIFNQSAVSGHTELSLDFKLCF